MPFVIDSFCDCDHFHADIIHWQHYFLIVQFNLSKIDSNFHKETPLTRKWFNQYQNQYLLLFRSGLIARFCNLYPRLRAKMFYLTWMYTVTRWSECETVGEHKADDIYYLMHWDKMDFLDWWKRKLITK